MPRSPARTIDLLKRAELAVRSRMQVSLVSLGITWAQYLTLLHLWATREASGADLAREIEIRPQSISEVVCLLERKGLLVRETRPANRRILYARLTDKGRALVADAQQIARRVEQEILEQLDSRQLSQLDIALSAILQRAQWHQTATHPARRRMPARIASRGASEPT